MKRTIPIVEICKKLIRRRDHSRLGSKLPFAFFRPAFVSQAELAHHVHIVGASGYGKSVLISHLLKGAIKQGHGILFIDLKSDRETLADLRRASLSAGREKDLKVFALGTTESVFGYNPVIEGNATQIRDRLLLSLTWSEEYYKHLTSSFLLRLLLCLCWMRDNQGFEFTLGTILNCTKSNASISALIGTIPEKEVKIRSDLIELYDFMSLKEYVSGLQGFRSQLESVVLSEYGRLLTMPKETSFTLFEAVQSQKVAYMVLDSRSYGETAKTIARLILNDLKAVSARIDSEIPKSDRKLFQVIIDEFADIAGEEFIGFLDRARSSRMSIVVAHQELSDLKRISPEFAARLTGNTSTCYAFLQKNKESAELIASMAGTREVRKETAAEEGFGLLQRPTGAVSVRMVEEFNIHPNVIKSLRVGECVCIKKYPYSRAYRVRVRRPE